MPRPTSSGSRLSPTQAQQILQALINDRRISAGELNRYLEIQRLEERLQSLRSGGGIIGRPVRRGWSGASQATAGQGGKRRRRRPAVTAEQAASRQLQGRYLALVRQIPASRRSQYAKIAKDRGRETAIREMQDALKK